MKSKLLARRNLKRREDESSGARAQGPLINFSIYETGPIFAPERLFFSRSYFSKVKRKFPKFRMGYTVNIEDNDSVSRFNDEWIAANIFVALNFLAKQNVNKRLGKELEGDMLTLFDPKRHIDPSSLF